MQNLVEHRDKAFFSTKESITTFQEFRCRVIPAWITKYPGLLSMAFAKKSPYKRFFQYKLFELLEKGAYDEVSKNANRR